MAEDLGARRNRTSFIGLYVVLALGLVAVILAVITLTRPAPQFDQLAEADPVLSTRERVERDQARFAAVEADRATARSASE